MGDNLLFMDYLAKQKSMEEKIDLIYIDPPFFSNANYKATTRVKAEGSDEVMVYTQDAYEDTWADGLEEYLRMITVRLFYMKDLLSGDGSIFIHLDWHVVHYVKIIADEIFGMENFINEIIWQYKSGGAGKRHFGRKHDTLLFYAKSKKYKFNTQKEKSYNRELRAYNFKGVEEFKDKTGWYTLVNMKDVWPINMVGRTSKERVDYATQKPEALLERIIESCTQEGSICADFFAGSGTLAAVAEKMGRKWVSCDSGDLAIAKTQKRLYRLNGQYDLLVANENQTGGSSGRGRNDVGSGVHPSPIERVDIQLLPTKAENKVKLKVQITPDEKAVAIDHWSVDFISRDHVYRPQIHYVRDKSGVEQKLEKVIAAPTRIIVKVTDVLGRVSYYEKENNERIC